MRPCWPPSQALCHKMSIQQPAGDEKRPHSYPSEAGLTRGTVALPSRTARQCLGVPDESRRRCPVVSTGSLPRCRRGFQTCSLLREMGIPPPPGRAERGLEARPLRGATARVCFCCVVSPSRACWVRTPLLRRLRCFEPPRARASGECLPTLETAPPLRGSESP
jgi:hypothetical protein